MDKATTVGGRVNVSYARRTLIRTPCRQTTYDGINTFFNVNSHGVVDERPGKPFSCPPPNTTYFHRGVVFVRRERATVVVVVVVVVVIAVVVVVVVVTVRARVSCVRVRVCLYIITVRNWCGDTRRYRPLSSRRRQRIIRENCYSSSVNVHTVV